jgi:4-hydroxybenzoate polyprenyltransferase
MGKETKTQPKASSRERQLVRAIWRSARPHQWISNLVIFAPLVFSEHLFGLLPLAQVFVGFMVFCGLSSTTFIVNDVIDRERDRAHPMRRHRPVAAGALPTQHALTAAIILAVVSLAEALIWQPTFGLMAAGYLAINVAYSLGLRRLPVVDVLLIAASLVLRAAAGAFLIQVKISPWLYLSVGGLGLVLALGRIQYEMRRADAAGTLEMDKYTPQAVARMNSVATAFTLIVYCLYTFLGAELTADYAMMLTIPFVIYGIFRYRYLAHRQADTSPERMMLSDPPLLLSVTFWVLSALAISYFLP